METSTTNNDSPAPGGMKSRLTAVVPCYNAGERLGPVVHGLLRQLESVIVVDDGSTDGAASSMTVAGAHVIGFPTNRGKGYAMLAGFRAALARKQSDGVVIVDADGQHDPGELPKLYDAFVREQSDLVVGSRAFDLAHVPWRSRFGNKTTALLTRILLGQRVDDTQSGFRIHSRKLVECIISEIPGGRYETEMEILVKAIKRKFKISCVPIQTIYEEGNPSSHFNKLRDSFRIYRKLFSSSWRR